MDECDLCGEPSANDLCVSCRPVQIKLLDEARNAQTSTDRRNG